MATRSRTTGAYARRILAQIGLPVAAMHELDNADAADAFLAANRGRYVFKLNGADISTAKGFSHRLAQLILNMIGRLRNSAA